MALILAEADVIDLIDISDAIEVTEAMYRTNPGDDTKHHNPIQVRMPSGSRFRITVGALLADGVMGARAGVVGSGDSTMVLLFDSPSGDLLCVMAYPFSWLRLGASMALAVKWLADGGPAAIGMVGTGRSALGLLANVAVIRPISSLRVYSRNSDARARFADDAAQHLVLDEVTPVATSQDAVAGADIVLCATNSDQAVFNVDALQDNVFVGTMGSPAELSEETLLRAQAIFVGSKSQEQQYHHYHTYREDVPRRNLMHLISTGKLEWRKTVRELADVIRGESAAPKSGLVVYKESQGGFGDVALAAAAFDKATQLGRGQQVDLSVHARTARLTRPRSVLNNPFRDVIHKALTCAFAAEVVRIGSYSADS